MKKISPLIFIIIFLQGIAGIAAQGDSALNLPARAPFLTNMLIDNQTVVSPFAGSLNLMIYHRFGSMKNGISDLFGIYGSANTRLGLEYGITDRIMVGIGSTMNYKLQDAEWKYAILRQTRSNKMPVSLSYYGNFVIDAREDDFFGLKEDYKFVHRISYFTQLIVSRRFSRVFSFQVAPEMAYYNGVDEEMDNFNLGVSLGGRAKIWKDNSIILEYDLPISNHEFFQPSPNLGIGLEMGTATHTFQIFISNYQDIVYQRNLVFNQNNKFQVGFNITVRF